MLKEVFKTYIKITEVTKDAIRFETKQALYKTELDEDAIEQILTPEKNYQFSKDDRLYFMPGCTVPRFKVKQLCKEIGLSVVKSPDSATVAIRGEETPEEIVKSDYAHYYFTKDQILNFVTKNYGAGVMGVYDLKKLLTLDTTFDVVEINDYSTRELMCGKNNVDWVITTTAPKTSTIYLWMSETKRLADFDTIIESGMKIADQMDLLAIINSHNMDEAMYYETKKMFESEDTNNRVLAMELMANCDYEKSAVYLLSLYQIFQSEIRNSKEVDHVNFKSFLKFFNLDKNNHTNLNNFVQKLIEKRMLTSSNLSILMNLVKEDLTKNLKCSYFEVTEIGPNEELTQAIAEADAALEAKLTAKQPVKPVEDEHTD